MSAGTIFKPDTLIRNYHFESERITSYFEIRCDRSEFSCKVHEESPRYSIVLVSGSRVTDAGAGNGRIITSAVSGSNVSDITIPDSRSCCRSSRKVGEPRDSVRFRTDAGVKVGHGSR